jgi:Glyoxalase/Bleomycin resistance protein/Dioxygenase superfamily
VDAYIWVEDVETLALELRKRGARILEGPVERPYGLRELLLEDLDGFRIAFGTHPDTE